MEFPKKQLLVVGDRVLITPEDGDERTRVGLYLPATAIDSQQVQTGLIVATGPGTPVADLSTLDDEPWKWTPGRAGAGACRRGSGTTPYSSARRQSRSPSKKRSTWWCPRLPFWCWYGMICLFEVRYMRSLLVESLESRVCA